MLNTTINLPLNVKIILDMLNEHGFLSYIVGGCVRDSLLGIKPKDWDITTNASPDEIESIFAHTIPTGKQYGTITVVLPGLDESTDECYEVTTFRADGNYSDGRRPDIVTFGTSLKEDIMRRDFTINALAYNEYVGIVDYVDGIKDLENGILRTVGKPEERFNEDALRLLRALRFKCKYNLTFDSNTQKAMFDGIINKHLLKNVSKERINSELIQIVKNIENISVDALEVIRKILCIELNNISLLSMIQFFKDFGVYNVETRFAFLLEEKSLVDLEIWLRDLKFSNNMIKSILNILNINKYVIKVKEQANENKEYINPRHIIKHLINKYGIESVKLSLPLIEYYNTPNTEFVEAYNDIMNSSEPLFLSELVIDGNYIINHYNIYGSEVGYILNKCMEKVLLEPNFNTIEKLNGYIKEILCNN